MTDISRAEIAKYIDHTILTSEATYDDVRKVCDEAKEYGFSSVIINGSYTKFVSEQLEGSGVKTGTVVGFPLGAMSPRAKAFEASDAVLNGAAEIDMVINIGAVKSGDWELVQRDIKGVVDAVRGSAIVKVIFEACLLTDEEKIKACEACELAGAAFVKTSTGLSTGGATEEDVRLMRGAVKPETGVKAAGGIRTYEDAVRMINAGATRLGTRAGVAIVSGPDKTTDSIDKY